MKYLVACILLALLCFSCQSPEIRHVNRAFYYWKSEGYDMRQENAAILDSVGAATLYVKFFEVMRDESGRNIPFSKTELDFSYASEVDTTLRIIPTVYLKNEVFLKSSKPELDTLAGNVDFLIRRYIGKKLQGMKPVTEIQMDCDWTPKSRDRYFYFLKALRQKWKGELSCTLRLYPYKYRETMGIPPVDKATLMCYNLLNPLQDKNRNSILDPGELELYVKGQPRYPMHLDVALPVYSWMQWYQNNSFRGVLYDDDKRFRDHVRPIKPMWYEVVSDVYVGDRYVRSGDVVKIEAVSQADILKSVEILKKHVAFDKDITVTLFDLNADRLKDTPNETLSRYFSAFTE